MKSLKFSKTYSLEVDMMTEYKEADSSLDDGDDENNFDEDFLTFSFTSPCRDYTLAIFEVSPIRVHIYTNCLIYHIFPP